MSRISHLKTEEDIFMTLMCKSRKGWMRYFSYRLVLHVLPLFIQTVEERNLSDKLYGKGTLEFLTHTPVAHEIMTVRDTMTTGSLT